MAQIRIQQKPQPEERRETFNASLPIALLLAAGLATTLWLENGRLGPSQVVAAVGDGAGLATGAAWDWLERAWLATAPIEAGGRYWVPAQHPAVTHFDDAEMVPLGAGGGWPLYANRVRGLPALSGRSGPYDRLYVRTVKGAYQPLRWRDVPRP